MIEPADGTMTIPIELWAGALSMRFCPRLAFLRHVVLHSDGAAMEVIRGIFPAVRNRDWDTISFQVFDLEVERGIDHFRIGYRAECDSFPFRWSAEVCGSSDGQVSYVLDGEATSELLKNRIGLCVLHPIEPCAGAPCRVEQVDGTIRDGVFPRSISPHQPFLNIRSISHQVAMGVNATVEFAGETFEMEDQRNWTDASFKTYSTPLDQPYPVLMPAGSVVLHRVTIRLSPGCPATTMPCTSPPAECKRRVSVDWSVARSRPAIGLSMDTTGEPLSSGARKALARLGLDHLRVDVALRSDRWCQIATEGLQLAAAIGAQLELALFVDRGMPERLADCAEWLSKHSPRLARILVFDRNAKATPDWLIEWMEQRCSAMGLDIPIAYGTNAYFAELNRNRPALPSQSLVCYSLNPQVHAFDELSLCETFAGQRSTVESAWEDFGRRIVISPITLRPRFNPNATSDLERCEPALPETDARQASQFAAAWTIGSMSQLAANPHVESLTWYETAGPRGVMSAEGQLYPVGDAIAAVLRSQACAPGILDRPLEQAAIGLVHHHGGREIVLGNLTDCPQSIELELPTGEVRLIELAPYAIDRIECKD